MKTNINSWPKPALLCCLLALSLFTYSQTNTWLGLSTNWDNPGNWSLGVVPSDPQTVHIALAPKNPVIANVTIVPGRTTGNVIIDDGVILTVNNQLNFKGTTWQGPTTGMAHVRGISYVHITGSLPQTFTGNTEFENLVQDDLSGLSIIAGNLSITNVLSLQGSNMQVSGNLTFRSTAPGQYGILENFGVCCAGVLSTIGSGTVTSEMFVSSTGYHELGTPVTADLAQLGANGVSGYYIPDPTYSPCDERYAASNSPNAGLWSWHENIPTNNTCFQVGWYGESAGTMATPGIGYISLHSAGSVLSVRGTPNQNATYTVSNLGNSNWASNSQQLHQPYYYGSGWHLLANPYQAPYHMAGSLNSDFDDAVIYQTTGGLSGTYQPLIAPSIYTGPSVVNFGFIAPFQAVMVHKTPGNTADFVFNISNATTAERPDFFKTAEATGKGLVLTVAGNGFKDITCVGFSDQATAGFDVLLDSRKLKSATGQPTLFTINNGNFLSVNTNHSMGETPTVEVAFSPETDGNYTIGTEGIENFDAADAIILEDKKTGQMIDLKQTNNYTFAATAADNLNRFALHFASPTYIEEAKSETFKMFGSGNTLFIDFSKLNTVDATIDVFDVLGRKLFSDRYASSSIYSKQLDNIGGAYVVAKVMTGGETETGKVFLADLNK